MTDMSEMSGWDGSQAPPNLSLVSPPAPFVTRAFKAGERCSMGQCAGCGRTLISAVNSPFINRSTGALMLHCANCYTWPKNGRKRPKWSPR